MVGLHQVNVPHLVAYAPVRATKSAHLRSSWFYDIGSLVPVHYYLKKKKSQIVTTFNNYINQSSCNDAKLLSGSRHSRLCCVLLR